MAHIEIYHKNNTFSISGDIGVKDKLKRCNPYNDFLIKKIKKIIKPKHNEIIFVMFSGCQQTNQKKIIQFIKNNNINKIYFFIEDVLRLYSNKNNFNWLDTYPLENDPDNVRSFELDIISNILEKTKCVYKIYHCEKNSTVMSKNYNLKIDYFDWYYISAIRDYCNDAFVINKKYNISKKISCFNLRFDYHRYIIALLVKDFDCVLSLNNLCSTKDLMNNKAIPIDNFSKEIKQKILENHKQLNGNPILWDAENNNDVISIESQKQKNNIDAIRSAFVDVVTETRYVSNMINLTEKTIKPIVAYRPFVLLGPIGTLDHLKSLGFKTFNDWWDESYDQESNHNKRLEMVYNIIKSINSKSISELEKMLAEMKPILEHNYKNLHNQFKKNKKYLIL